MCVENDIIRYKILHIKGALVGYVINVHLFLYICHICIYKIEEIWWNLKLIITFHYCCQCNDNRIVCQLKLAFWMELAISCSLVLGFLLKNDLHMSIVRFLNITNTFKHISSTILSTILFKKILITLVTLLKEKFFSK